MTSDLQTAVRIEISEADFDLNAELSKMRTGRTDIGAICSFIGLVRESNLGSRVSSMTLEHYPGMTERTLRNIVAVASQRWPLQAVTVIHRVGKLLAADNIVLVLVASAHRQAAFLACEYIMDFLKTDAPFWKQESTENGVHWVDARVSDSAALQRWNQN
jgi:molybdopterin synthase catalytic subunit